MPESERPSRGEEIRIEERSFLINSDFRIPSAGAALFGEAAWSAGRWTLSAGLRLDAEWTAMQYASTADIHYLFTMVMQDYALLSASLSVRRGALTLTLWGENLTDTACRVFWFRSLQRDFFAAGRPMQWGLRINYNL